MKKLYKILNLILALPILFQMLGFSYLAHSSCEMDCCKVIEKNSVGCSMNEISKPDVEFNTRISKCSCNHEEIEQVEYLTGSSIYDKALKITGLLNSLISAPENKCNTPTFSNTDLNILQPEKLYIINSAFLI